MQIPADKFTRIVYALATRYTSVQPGSEWLFMVAPEVEVRAWVPREGHVFFAIGLFDGDDIATATVCPGEYRPFEVISDGVVLGETKGADAAFSMALGHLLDQVRAS